MAAGAGILQFPEGSVRGFEHQDVNAKIEIAVGPYAAGHIKTEQAEGVVQRVVWKTPISQSETLGLINPLKSQLQEAGYTVLYECQTRECGGFDFRFNASILDEPDMHVDLGDFRYLCATKLVDGKEDFVSLVVSRSPERGFVQMTSVSSALDVAPEITVSSKSPEPSAEIPVPKTLADNLAANGSVVLAGLEFLQGSSDLSGTPAESLRELAAFLATNPKKTVVLVGHTDASGTLEGNIALSRRRAQSVVKQLVETYGVDPVQITAEGVGYLAPRASNVTRTGRDKNRRVEVVLASVTVGG